MFYGVSLVAAPASDASALLIVTELALSSLDALHLQLCAQTSDLHAKAKAGHRVDTYTDSKPEGIENLVTYVEEAEVWKLVVQIIDGMLYLHQ